MALVFIATLLLVATEVILLLSKAEVDGGQQWWQQRKQKELAEFWVIFDVGANRVDELNTHVITGDSQR